MIFILCAVTISTFKTAYSRDLVLVESPKIFSDRAGIEEQASAMVSRAAHLANRRFGEYAGFTYEDGKVGTYDYRAVIQVFDESLTLLLRDTNGRETDSAAILGELTDYTVLHLSDLLFYQWSSFHDFHSSEMGQPPLLIDEIPSATISESVLPEMPATLVPTSTASRENGNLLVGLSMICVELNRFFGIVDQPGRSLYEAGDYSFAASVATTPGGTIFFKPSVGRALYRLSPGMESPKRIRTGMDVMGPFLALHDGSVVLIDLQKKQSIRIADGKRRILDLKTGPYSYITAGAAGPENSLWVYDAFERRVRIYTAEGVLIDSVMPLVDPSIGTNVLSLAVYSDGSFVLFYSGGMLRAYNHDGTPRWELTTLGAGVEEPLPLILHVAVDAHRGIIHLSDQMGARLLKLLDLPYAESQNIGVDFEEGIAKLTLEQSLNPDDWSPTVNKAQLYEQKGSYEMAKYQWELVLENDMEKDVAPDKLDALDVTILKSNARHFRRKTVYTLETLGPESARRYYSTTIRMYERILAIRPDDGGVREEMESLRRLFHKRERGESAVSIVLTEVHVEMDNLFPSLMQFYRRHPVGHISVRNTLDRNISNLMATVNIRKYMDFPAETEAVQILRPDEQVNLDVYLLMNEHIFGVQENLPLQARVELSYNAGNTLRQSHTVELLLYRRTAISWDDSAKLASFITPHEGIVTEFSHRVAGTTPGAEQFRLPDTFLRAARICDALGTFDIEYIEDPDSPISEILGNPKIIDTVRFARTTLLIRAGDCDDTTALLSSLLESSGIETAIMTSPSHVFLAFNTGEPDRNSWMYRTPRLETLEHGGTVWIPMETTVLQKGFIAAWQEASQLIKKHKTRGETEFLPVQKQRLKYPPLSIPASDFRVVEPPQEDIDRLYTASLDGMKENIYREIAGILLDEASSADEQTNRAALNRAGILHARFGSDVEAEEVFLQCIVRAPDYIPPYVNLAQLYLLQDDIESALTILGKAEGHESKSAQVHLLFARCYNRMGDNRQVTHHLKKVKIISPLLAERNQFLLDSHGVRPAGQRAGASDDEILWYTGE
jgi:tetratricopeptide (TPR) repeat protein